MARMREKPTLESQANGWFVSVEAGRADELREHLRSHNIRSAPAQPADGRARLELQGDVDPDAVRAILDLWED